MSEPAPTPPLEVQILALPASAPMAIYGLFEVLGSAGRLWPRLTGRAIEGRAIHPTIVARVAQPFPSGIGIPITPQLALRDAPAPHVIIVPDVELPMVDDPASAWSEEIAWLQAAAAGTAVICSTCTGSLVLAEAGLLAGRDAASHWSAEPVFRDRYPNVRYRPDRILCDSGLDGRLITSGGASSWQDLALYLIGRFCGAEEAARTSKIFLIGDRSEGQLPFAAMAQPRSHDDAAIAGAQAWIAEHYETANAVAAMEAQSGLSSRTFKRRFRQATGYTPVEYVQALRIEEAKQSLETGGGSVEEIAAEVGYEDPTFFRRLFKRHVGTTPARYRRKMQAAMTMRRPVKGSRAISRPADDFPRHGAERTEAPTSGVVARPRGLPDSWPHE